MEVKVGLSPTAQVSAPVGIVIDVLRATSTITQALASGYERVICVGEVEEARALAGDGVRLAGERFNVLIEGFDFGNSPRELTGEPTGHTLVLTTTNGTRLLLAAAARCETVLVASLLNLDAIVAEAAKSDEVAVLCAGVEGEFAIDDAYVAGRIAAALDPNPVDDSAVAAVRLAQSFATTEDGIGAGISAQNIRDNKLTADIPFCAQESILSIVPRIVERGPNSVTIAI